MRWTHYLHTSFIYPQSLTPDNKSSTESAIKGDQKRKYTQISSDEQETDESDAETLHTKIERLALENSFDDHDFEVSLYIFSYDAQKNI